MSTTKPVETLDSVIIRFAGDSGDGMQLTGTRFTETTALAGTDVATLPDYPAEIRAPAGTIGGVSGFQLQFASRDIFTPGDSPNVLVAMNPAALKKSLEDLKPGAMIIVNQDTFTAKAIKKVGFEFDPLEEGQLSDYQLFQVPITKATVAALADIDLSSRNKERCKNFFALGLTFWLFGRKLEPTREWITAKFGAGTMLEKANHIALQKGHDFGNITEAFATTYHVEAAPQMAKGTYRNITGNAAAAYGFVAAAKLAERPLVLGTYPITPASDILHELAKLKHFGVKTIQAEDEIAAVGVAIGASYGGAIGLTTTSGPGVALKGEAIGLATATELPLIIVDVQRGGPSTGLPTKTEQSDLFIAMWGRHGDAPTVVMAPASPGECFDMAIDATRVATKYMTPVLFLTDSYVANTAEPWLIPNVDEFKSIAIPTPTDAETFLPYDRDPETLSRPWAPPGTPGMEHRIGGLERKDGSGHVTYDGGNHALMAKYREEKLERIALDIPDLKIEGDADSDVLVMGWGSSYGAIRGAEELLETKGKTFAYAQLRYLNPMPANTEKILRSYKKVIIPELNMGQLTTVLRAKYLLDVIPFTKVTGFPFRVDEIAEFITGVLEEA